MSNASNGVGTPVNTNPLNLAERAYVSENYAKGVEALAEILKRPKALVEFELNMLEQQRFEQERAPVAEPKNAVKPEEVTTVVKDSPLLNSFVRRKEGGIVAINAASSMLSDELGKSQGKKSVLETRPDIVTRVRK